MVARTSRAALKNIGNSSLDFRGSKGFKGIASATGINAGAGKDKGFTDLNKAAVGNLDKAYQEAKKPTYEQEVEIGN